jgi:uncharacterized membrane protein
MRDPLDQLATPDRLRAALAAAGASDATMARGLAIADATPSRREWASFLSTALLLLGAALVLAGTISFFAFNWASLGRYGKFALLEGAVAACAIAGWKYHEALVGRVTLFAAGVLVGPLLGVYGQTYQTGADPWGLFAAWALLIAPWVVAACFTPLWLLAIALVDTALVLYWQQAIDPGRNGWLALFIVMATVHAVAVCAWEWQRLRPSSWLVDTWGPRLVLASGFLLLLIPAEFVLVDPTVATSEGPYAVLGLVLLGTSAAAAFMFYQRTRRDLFMLTAVAGTAFVLVTTAVGRVMFNVAAGLESFLLMALIIVGEIGAAVAWLRRVQREWGEA